MKGSVKLKLFQLQFKATPSKKLMTMSRMFVPECHPMDRLVESTSKKVGRKTKCSSPFHYRVFLSLKTPFFIFYTVFVSWASRVRTNLWHWRTSLAPTLGKSKRLTLALNPFNLFSTTFLRLHILAYCTVP